MAAAGLRARPNSHYVSDQKPTGLWWIVSRGTPSAASAWVIAATRLPCRKETGARGNAFVRARARMDARPRALLWSDFNGETLRAIVSAVLVSPKLGVRAHVWLRSLQKTNGMLQGARVFVYGGSIQHWLSHGARVLWCARSGPASKK